MKTKKSLRALWRFSIIICLSLQYISTLEAQERKKVAVIPVSGSELAVEDNWQLIGDFNEFLKSRYNFIYVEQSQVRNYFATHSIPLESDADELKSIARDLKVEVLLLPKVTARNNRNQLVVSLFDTTAATLTKKASEPCDCQPGTPSSFPYQKIAELLFDAPEIILAGEREQGELLPPPSLIELPTVPVPTDTTARPPEPESDAPDLPVRRRKGGAWKKYAIGAVLLSGGIIYFATRGGDSNGGGVPLTKLNDPPDPPNN